MHVHIVTPHGVHFEGEVEKITVPGKNGQMTILPHHSSLTTSLIAGNVKYTPLKPESETALEQFAEHEKSLPIPGGICHIKHNTVEVIVS